MNFQKIKWIGMAVFVSVFCLFVLVHEHRTYQEAQRRIDEHANIISDALWNYNSQGASQYLSLACKTQNYEYLVVTDGDGKIFQEVVGETPPWSDQFLMSLRLIPRVPLAANILHDGRTIGRVKAIWQPTAIYLQINVLFLLAMAFLIFHLYVRLLQSKSLLEDRVKQRTLALQKSEQRFRDLFNAISDLVYTHDLDGRFLSINPAMRNVFGYEMDEIIGKPITDFMKPEFGRRFQSEYLEAVKTKGFHEGVTVYFAKDGHKIFVEYRSSLTLPENGEPFISGAGRDMTERITTRKKIKKLREEIIQAHKMEAVGTLAGGLAHDFNNILGIIIGNTELALGDVPASSSTHANLSEIKTAGLRAKQIIRQLLSFSRKTEEKVKPVEIVPLIEETLQFLRSTIATSVEIQKKFKATHGTILADPVQINQVMMNLCINASHAMEQTGGVLEVLVENVSLRGRAADRPGGLGSGDYVAVTVRDTGPGIDPGIIDRIFDPYFTTKEVGKGSGMGLAVVKGIVKSHGGGISVHCEPGHGCTFRVFFPLTKEKPEVETPAPPKLPSGHETILFVDDEEAIVDMTRAMLERLGYRVETAMTPQQALDRFAAAPGDFDLVITDMTMPQMTGKALAEKIQAIRKELPVIICTGYSPLIDENSAKNLDFAAYIMKPIRMQEIAQTVRKVLDNPDK